MKHTLAALAVALAAAGLAIAGDAPVLKGPGVLAQEIDRLCRSTNPRDVAWGAYLAATHAPAPGAKDADAWIAPLETALAKHATSEEVPGRLVSRAILDAFVQRRARPTPATLARCIRRHAGAVIVLCAQDPKRYEAVLRAMLAPGLPDVQWMAVANLLRARKLPGALFQVLRGASTKLEVSVLVAKNSAIGVGGGFAGAPRSPVAARKAFLKVPEDWPPAVHYGIADYVWPGWVVLAPGSHPVFYKRHESGAEVRASGTFSGGGERTAYRASITRNAFRYHVLADAMGWPFHEMRVSQFARKVVYWEGEEHFLQEVAKKRYFLRLYWDGEIDSIQRGGYLTKEEASQLELEVPIESTWMALGPKRRLPDVPEGILEQEQERRKRKRAVGTDGGR